MTEAPRKSANLSLPEDLLQEARRLGLNISRAAEAGLADSVAADKSQWWRVLDSGLVVVVK